MVAEVRYIIFSTQELSKALIVAHQKKGTVLPSGTIHSIEQDSRPGVKVTITVAPDRSSDPIFLDASEDEVLAALVGFCRESKIPLPANSSKSLGSIRKSLCLVVTLNVTEDKFVDFERAISDKVLS
jgi:hypothetical protein